MVCRLLSFLSILLLLFGLILGLKTHKNPEVGERVISFCLDKGWATEETGQKDTKEETKGKAEKTEEGHGESPPFMYFAQWAALMSAFGLGLWYAIKVRTKGKPRHEGITLAYVLTIFVLLYFALGYYPAVVEYHEPGIASLLKFLLLIATGILVTLYGVLGRHEER